MKRALPTRAAELRVLAGAGDDIGVDDADHVGAGDVGVGVGVAEEVVVSRGVVADAEP